MSVDEIIKALETEVLCENCPHNGSKCLQDGCYYIEASKIIKGLKSRAEKAEREKGCEYCNPVTSKFEPVLISDTEDYCKWCPKEKCDNHEDSCYGVGYTEVPLNYCIFCGKKLDNRACSENETSMNVKEEER